MMYEEPKKRQTKTDKQIKNWYESHKREPRRSWKKHRKRQYKVVNK